MNNIQITYFITVARCESFSKAADELFVSQPAVSKQIHLLEEEWGLTLFTRRYRTVALTPAGILMLEHVQLAGIAMDTALQRARELDKVEKKRLLEIGLFEHCNLTRLPRIFMEYESEHTDVSIDFENSNFYALQEGLYSKRYDLVLTFNHMLPNRQIVETQPFMRARHIAYISRDHPLAKLKDLTFQDLSGLRFYVPTFEGSALTSNHATNVCATQGVVPMEFKRVPNIESALLAVRMCKGAVILDSFVSIHNQEEFIALPTDVSSEVVFAWLKDDGNLQIRSFVQYVIGRHSEGGVSFVCAEEGE